MSKKDVESFIRQRKRSTRSIDEQVQIAHAKWADNVDQDHDGIKRKEIEDELGLSLRYKAGTSLHHLEEIGIVEEFTPPGPPVLVIAEWMNDGEGKVVLGEVDEAAQEGLEALAGEIGSPSSGSGTATAADGGGVTTRSVVASEFDLVPEKVEDYLRATDKPVKVLNRAVEAIEEADGIKIGDDYGEIAFINMPYRYRLTQMAVDLYKQ